VAAFAGDFDDSPEEEEPLRPPLPLEDRLWRHPSELGSANPSLHLDPVAVRRRWLTTEPSRASAWTAGIVGALLATGLVVLGTHLATAITGGTVQDEARPTLTTASASVTARGAAPALAPSLARAVARAGASVAAVDTTRDGTSVHGLGLVVRSDGMILVPAEAVDGASAILVTLADDDNPYVGTLVGLDRASGLAVVHVNAVTALPVAPFTTTSPRRGELAIALTAPGGADDDLATVRAPDGAGAGLVDAMSLGLPPDAPLGSTIVDGRGEVVGMLAGPDSAVPSWLELAVAAQLMHTGRVRHGWLGVTVQGAADGAEVVAVAPDSAAAAAGLQPGDVIEAIDGHAVGSTAVLLGRLYALRPHVAVLLRVERAGRARSVHALLEDRP